MGCRGVGEGVSGVVVEESYCKGLYCKGLRQGAEVRRIGPSPYRSNVTFLT